LIAILIAESVSPIGAAIAPEPAARPKLIGTAHRATLILVGMNYILPCFVVVFETSPDRASQPVKMRAALDR
jgi:hypothetical protein